MGRNKRVSDEAVLEAARAVFVEHGFGASTREVAHRAGISEAVLYQRFKTKVALFFAAMIPPPIEIPRVARGTPNLEKELGALATGMMRYFRDAMPVFLQVMTHPSFSLCDLAHRESHLKLHGLIDAIAACLERHRVRGAIRSDGARIPSQPRLARRRLRPRGRYRADGGVPEAQGNRRRGHARRAAPPRGRRSRRRIALLVRAGAVQSPAGATSQAGAGRQDLRLRLVLGCDERPLARRRRVRDGRLRPSARVPFPLARVVAHDRFDFSLANIFCFMLTSKAGWRKLVREVGLSIRDEGTFNGMWFAVLERPS
jgi:AcrR family transcriptional regulator